MNHIWRYLQTEEDKNVVIVCEHNDQAERIIKDIADKIKRHSILNSKKITKYPFTRNSLVYGTNNVFVFQYSTIGWRLRGLSINLFLTHDNLTNYQRAIALKNAMPCLRHNNDSIIGKYKEELDFVSSYL